MKTASTRDRILNAALKVFSQAGFHGCSIPMLAKKAKIATGGLYVHFKNKEALVNELYVDWKSRFLATLSTAASGSGTFEERYGRLWNACVDFAGQSPEAFAFLESHYHETYLSAAAREVENRVNELARRFVREAQAAGEVRPGDPDVLISIVFGTIVQIFRQDQRGLRTWTPQNLKAAGAACWSALKA